MKVIIQDIISIILMLIYEIFINYYFLHKTTVSMIGQVFFKV